MKKYLRYFTALVFCVSCYNQAFSQCDWQPVGPNDFDQPAYYISNLVSLALDRNNFPYVVYSDQLFLYAATVSRYNGSTWTIVGNEGFTTANISYPSLAIDNSNRVFVAYNDATHRPYVMEYNGSNWQYVDSITFCHTASEYTQVSLDKYGTPYVVFKDNQALYSASVMKFNGSNWSYVGTRGFSPPYASYESMAIDSSGMPCVAFSDNSQSDAATVMRFNGISWGNIGSPGFSSVSVDSISIRINKYDTLYVAYEDRSNGMKATVMKFNGSSWINVGAPDFSLGSAKGLTMAFDSNGYPTVSFADGSDSGKVTVMHFNNGTWSQLGSQNFVPTTSTSIAYTNGITYVAYEHEPILVSEYNGADWSLTGDQPIASVSVAGNSMVSDDSGNVYLAYCNVFNFKTTVVRYNGIKWDTIGAPNFFYGKGKLAIDNHDTLYMAFPDSHVSVLKFNGTSWVYVGPPNFAPPAYTASFAPSIAFDTNNLPYIVFTDGYTQYLMHYSGGIWSMINYTSFNIGGPVYIAISKQDTLFTNYSGSNVYKYVPGRGMLSVGNLLGHNMSSPVVLDSTGTPYVLSSTNAMRGDNLFVVKFNNNRWDTIGKPFGVGANYSSIDNNLILQLNKSGQPFAFYIDSIKGGTSIDSYNGNSWVSLGSHVFSPEGVFSCTMILDKKTTPYVSYQAWDNYQIWIKKYGGPYLLINTSADSICQGSNITLTASGMQTYVWSNGVSNGVPFNPSATNTYTLIARSSNGCIDTATVKVSVRTPQTINFNLASDSVCLNNGMVNLVATPVGGNFNGTGVSSNHFNPLTSGVGTFAITYSYTDNNGCSNSAIQDITVNSVPAVTFNIAHDTVCLDSGIINLIGSPLGGNFSGTAINSNNFNPFLSGVGIFSITYLYTDSLGCSNASSHNIIVDSCNNLVSGITAITNKSISEIYPNPNEGVFSIVIQNIQEDSWLLIYNVLNEPVFNSKLSSKDTHISLPKVSSGTYWYKITSNDGKIETTGKLLIEK